MKGSPFDLILLGAIVLGGMQPGGRGAIVINIITVHWEGGSKKGQKPACVLNQWPQEVLNNFPEGFSNSKDIEV